jgi:hypothetical protein
VRYQNVTVAIVIVIIKLATSPSLSSASNSQRCRRCRQHQTHKVAVVVVIIKLTTLPSSSSSSSCITAFPSKGRHPPSSLYHQQTAVSPNLKLTAQSSEQSGKAIEIGCCSSVVQKQTKQPTHANLHQSKNKLLSSNHPFINNCHHLSVNVLAQALSINIVIII